MIPHESGTPRVAEFFAGIGLAKLGLEKAGLEVVWSNDLSPLKHQLFERIAASGAGHEYLVADLANVEVEHLPPQVSVAWASFPCTDLSVAGMRRGINSGASAAFWHFERLLQAMKENMPATVLIENVPGFITNHGGRDARAAILALNALGYSVDALHLDARRFVPQSRPRVFLVGRLGQRAHNVEPSPLRPSYLEVLFSDRALSMHREPLPTPPVERRTGLGALLADSKSELWWSTAAVEAALDSLSRTQAARVEQLRQSPGLSFRTGYRRMRSGVARWEFRSDDIAGCLRTASGGSSRQAVLRAGDGEVAMRWLEPTEYARLMGVSSADLAGINPYDAYTAFGDAVCVPVVEWLARHVIVDNAQQRVEQVAA